MTKISQDFTNVNMFQYQHSLFKKNLSFSSLLQPIEHNKIQKKHKSNIKDLLNDYFITGERERVQGKQVRQVSIKNMNSTDIAENAINNNNYINNININNNNTNTNNNMNTITVNNNNNNIKSQKRLSLKPSGISITPKGNNNNIVFSYKKKAPVLNDIDINIDNSNSNLKQPSVIITPRELKKNIIFSNKHIGSISLANLMELDVSKIQQQHQQPNLNIKPSVPSNITPKANVVNLCNSGGSNNKLSRLYSYKRNITSSNQLSLIINNQMDFENNNQQNLPLGSSITPKSNTNNKLFCKNQSLNLNLGEKILKSTQKSTVNIKAFNFHHIKPTLKFNSSKKI